MTEAEAIVKAITEGDDFDVKDLMPEETPKFDLRPVEGLLNVFDVFVHDKWVGRINRNVHDPHAGLVWGAHWMPRSDRHPQPVSFKTALEAAQWLWDHRVLIPHDRNARGMGVTDSLEDDEEGLGKEMEINIGFYVGARVKILSGQYEGETGTVVGKTSFGAQRPGEHSFLVHLDGDEEDPTAAIGYRGEQLALIGDVEYPAGMRVKITAGQYAGVSGYVTGADRREQIVWVHPDTMEDEWGTVQIPLTDVVSLNETEKSVKKIIAEVTDDDEEGMKDYAYNPLSMAVQALKDAGFKILQAERREDQWILEFEWAAPTTFTYVDGAKRAREVLEPYIPIGPGHYATDYRGTRKEGIAKIYVRKRVEEDPNLWKILPPEHPTFQGHWKIIYSDKPVAEVYTTEGGAQRIKEEMAALHKISFFPVQRPGVGWMTYQGNAWASGPAIHWWRMNRHRLPPHQRVAEHFVDKQILGQ